MPQTAPEAVCIEPEREIEAAATWFAHGQVLDQDSELPLPGSMLILFRKAEDFDLIPLDTVYADTLGEFTFLLQELAPYLILAHTDGRLAREVELEPGGKNCGLPFLSPIYLQPGCRLACDPLSDNQAFSPQKKRSPGASLSIISKER